MGTAVTGCSMLNVTGKGVIYGETHRQRQTPNWFQQLQVTARKM